MKNFKRFASVVMVIMMMLSMMLPAMAGKITVPGTITDDKNEAKETYTAYKIFDVTKLMVQDTDDDGNPLVDKDNKPIMKEAGWAYSIPKDDPWVEKLNGKITEGEGEGAITTPAQGFVELTISADGTQYIVKPVGDFASTDAATASAAAKDFAAWLLNNKPTVDGIILNEGENTVADGYYLITSSLGSALALTTTDVAVDITEKNSYPTLTKSVDDHEAQIGDTVEFTIKVTVPATVDKVLTVHDIIEDGLNIDPESFEVKVGETALTENTHYTVKNSSSDGCSFEVDLNATDAVKGKTVVITYEAELDKDAVIYNETNDNTAWLTYSNYQTPESTVNVKTFKATVTKVDSSGKQLEDAEFKLYKQAEGGSPIELVDITAENANEKTYKVADSTQIGVKNLVCQENHEHKEECYVPVTTTTIVAGKAIILGLDSEKEITYYLEETKAPNGYNMLNYREAISLTETTENDDGTETTINKNAEINVVNKTGTELPSTGGIGTTIFYCAGAILAVGAFVLLITKKRMSKEV